MGIVVYIVIGYFVTRNMTDSRDEFFGALMLIWPWLLLGSIVKRILVYFNIYHPFFKYFFVTVAVIAIIALFIIYSDNLFPIIIHTK